MVTATDSVGNSIGSGQISVTAIPANGTLILFLGDSLTQLPGLVTSVISALNNSSYAANTGTTFYAMNGGIGGSDTPEYVNNSVYYSTMLGYESDSQCQFVSIMHGTNDANISDPLYNYQANMLAISNSLLANAPISRVILNEPPYSTKSDLNNNPPLLPQYPLGLDAIANGITIMNGDRSAYTDVMVDPSLYLSDGIHLSSAGQTLVGGLQAQAIIADLTEPTIYSVSTISPSVAAAGGNGFTLTVNGTGFAQGATVIWNGSQRTTTYISPTQVTAAITSTDIARAGSASVWVYSPGGISNIVSLSIAALPTLSAINPPTIVIGAGQFTLTLTGTNFTPTSAAQWDGTALSTTYVSSTTLTAAVPANYINSTGTSQITVENANLAVQSQPQTLTIVSGNLTATVTAMTTNSSGNPIVTMHFHNDSLNTISGAEVTSAVIGTTSALDPFPLGLPSIAPDSDYYYTFSFPLNSWTNGARTLFELKYTFNHRSAQANYAFVAP